MDNPSSSSQPSAPLTRPREDEDQTDSQPTSRRKISKEKPLHPRTDDPSDDLDEPAHIYRRINALDASTSSVDGDQRIMEVQVGSQEIQVQVSVSEEEVESALKDPLIQEHLLQEYPKEKLQKGMKEELQIMKDFDVMDEIPASSLTQEEQDSALDTTWAYRWKGSDVRCRLCIRGCFQVIEDLDLLFASTPTLHILKLLIIVALSMGLGIYTFDITTAFLHAMLNPSDPAIRVWPPWEFYPGRSIIW